MSFEEHTVGDCRLILGDCLEVLATLEQVDAVIMDPPYCSGARQTAHLSHRQGMSRSEIWKQSPLPNDRMSITGFTWLMRTVSMACEALLPDGGSLLSFIDWRQYPTLYGVLEAANFRIQTMVVWDKVDLALGYGFRNQHELIIHAAKETPHVYDRSVPNVLRHKRLPSSKLHPTEKPVALLDALVRVVTAPDAMVLDPFAGSFTTGLACLRLGRRFVGIEIERRYFDLGCARLEAAHAAALEVG